MNFLSFFFFVPGFKGYERCCCCSQESVSRWERNEKRASYVMHVGLQGMFHHSFFTCRSAGGTSAVHVRGLNGCGFKRESGKQGGRDPDRDDGSEINNH
jgi:hypothetical protein